MIDTGVDPAHPDLSSALGRGSQESFARLDRTIIDHHYHGTHIAGIIAGDGSASQGKYRGIAPDVDLFVYKVTEKDEMDEGAVSDAIAQAISDRVDILNYSASHSPLRDYGPPPWVWSPRSELEDDFERAQSKGILCVVAAGNDGLAPNGWFGSINRPGGSMAVLTVGNVGSNDRISGSSSRGPYHVLGSLRHGAKERYDAELQREKVEVRSKPDLVAPGEDVAAAKTSHSTSMVVQEHTVSGHGGHYVLVSGTSQATAVVSGVAACLLELTRQQRLNLGVNPGRTLKALLMRGTRHVPNGARYEYGQGIVDWTDTADVVNGCKANPALLESLQRGETVRALP